MAGLVLATPIENAFAADDQGKMPTCHRTHNTSEVAQMRIGVQSADYVVIDNYVATDDLFDRATVSEPYGDQGAAAMPAFDTLSVSDGESVGLTRWRGVDRSRFPTRHVGEVETMSMETYKLRCGCDASAGVLVHNFDGADNVAECQGCGATYNYLGERTAQLDFRPLGGPVVTVIVPDSEPLYTRAASSRSPPAPRCAADDQQRSQTPRRPRARGAFSYLYSSTITSTSRAPLSIA